MLLENLVIGNSVESALYAFLSDSYFLTRCSYFPLFYQNQNFQFLASKRTDYCWSRLILLLSLSGRLIDCDNDSGIKVSNNNLKVSSTGNLSEYQFKSCKVFDTTGVQFENDILKHRPPHYLVVDDLELSNLGGKHKKLEHKVTTGDFARKIFFYTSDRVDGASYITDCAVESLLTKEQLQDFDYSDSMTRFAVIRHLTSIGIHGTFMNYYKSGKPKFRKPRVKHIKRVIVEKENNLYQDSENIKFLNMSAEHIFDRFSTKGS